MSIPHLLEKQREEFKEDFNHNDLCSTFKSDLSPCDCGYENIEFRISTIQQEILQATKEKIEEMSVKPREIMNTKGMGRAYRVDAGLVLGTLKTLSSWLEGEKK